MPNYFQIDIGSHSIHFNDIHECAGRYRLFLRARGCSSLFLIAPCVDVGLENLGAAAIRKQILKPILFLKK